MLAVTKLSSKGQVIIPDDIRKEFALEVGTQFLVYAEKDAIVFKIVQAPAREDFDKVLARARTAAKKAGLKKEMIAEEIKKYRKGRKRR